MLPRRIAALRVLARLLAGEDPRRVPGGAWDAVLDVAEGHAVAGGLWAGLSPEDRMAVPTGPADRLRHEHRANVARNLRLGAELRRVVTALHRSDVIPTLFKGSAWLAIGPTPDLGARWMADLDLAVRPEDRDAALAALAAAGWTAPPEKPFWHTHEIALARAGGAAPLELHVGFGGAALSAILPPEEAWSASRELTLGDASVRVLSPTHAVLHNLVHSIVQDATDAAGDLDLRGLLDLRRLAGTGGPSVEWDIVRGRLREHGRERELETRLWLAHRYTGMPLPAEVPVRAHPGHELHAVLATTLGWPRAHRAVRYALGAAYLDSLYDHGDRPLALLVARLRHTARIVGTDPRAAADALLGRRA